MALTLQETKDYLDTLPGVLALWWFIENVNDEDPNRSELFFYCRERVRRYSNGRTTSQILDAANKELRFDKQAFIIYHTDD